MFVGEPYTGHIDRPNTINFVQPQEI